MMVTQVSILKILNHAGSRRALCWTHMFYLSEILLNRHLFVFLTQSHLYT